MPLGAPCRESYPQGMNWVGHQRVLNLAFACKPLLAPAQMSPEPNLELSQAPTRIPPWGVFADVTFWNASSPLCGSTGYWISPHLPPSQTMPWIYGSGRRTQPSKQLLWHSHGDGWQCSQVLLEPLSCLLPQLEWEGTLCGQHPPWQLLEEWLLCKCDTGPTHMSQWDPGTLCHRCLGMGQERDPPPGPGELLATANTQTLQLTLCLCFGRYCFVSEPELQTSFLLLSASH